MRGIRLIVAFVAIALMAVPAFGQCSSGSCGMGGMAAASGGHFRCKPRVKPVRATLKFLGRTAKGIARAGLQALPVHRRPYCVAADAGGKWSPLYREQPAFIRGPLGIAWYKRTILVPVNRKHEKANGGGVESRT